MWKQKQTAATPHTALTNRCTSSGEDIMMNLINYVKSFAKTEEGQDLLEYALLVALIALVAVVAVTASGNSVSTIFTRIATSLTPAA
jgi:pilus assembly protein Flp/PilA